MNSLNLESPKDGDNFSDICGLYIETSKEMEKHYDSSHELVTCKLCKTIIASLGSHCSVHDEIETDDKLKLEEFKDCRLLLCNVCTLWFDVSNLKEYEEASNLSQKLPPNLLVILPKK